MTRYYIEYRSLDLDARRRSTYRGPWRSDEVEALRLYHDCDVAGATKHLYRMEHDGTEVEINEETIP